MASSLFVNTLQVDFTSVLTMEHAGMVRMFKTLEDTGLRGFLEGTTPIFESAVVEFFSNARVIAGTIRQHKPSGWPSTTQPDPISALTTALEEFSDEQILQGGGVDNFADNLDLYVQTAQDEPRNQNIDVVRPHPIALTEGEGTNTDDEQRDHGSQEPTTLEINLSEQGKGEVNLDDGLNNDARTEHERQPEPDYITDASKIHLHDSIPTIPVNHEGNVAYQHTANSPQKPDDVVPIQVAQEGGNPEMVDEYCTRLIMTAREKLLEWAETEDITELSKRRSLILYKLLQTELEKLYLAHLANFKTNAVSAHREFECICRLHQELQLIATAHRHQRGLVGLPFTTPECDFVPKFSPALEIYNLTGTTQGSVQDTYPQHEQHVNQTAIHASYEHNAQENEPLIPEADHEHQDPDFSNLHRSMLYPLTYPPLTNHMFDFVMIRTSPDITLPSFATSSKSRLKDLISELMFWSELSLNEWLTNYKSQLAVIVEDLKESGAAKKGECGSSSRPSGHERGGSSSQGGRGKGRSDDSEIFKYSKWV
ncbi:hypothetical protein F511_11996 [Dorcoceras hygrometricum]|uniref:Uncharacterized protein n=1 Tax=Dorcoceras hygrometricum TaxID=472368 RepID=A0A2Z7BXZ3_9LAMI|nr:hypothetical protein F511_11996 [Dorcoceras hygrometricum]